MYKYFDINRNGHSIKCKLYCQEPRSIRSVILFGHGFGGHKDNKAAQRFAETVLSKKKDTAVLVFNWPCHGDDVKKKLTLSDCSDYITAVREYVGEQYGTEDVCVNATSFGAYLFLKYISEEGNPFRRLVLRCPAVNMYESLRARIMTPADREKLEKGKEALVGFDRKICVTPQFLEELRQADIQKRDFVELSECIRILHGTKDEVIPFPVVQAFAEENLIECIPIEKADHRFQEPSLMAQAIKKTLEFYE